MSNQPSPTDPTERYVDGTPYDPTAEADVGGARPDLDMPTSKLIRKRFFKHKLAVISAIFLAFLYLCVPFVELIAPYDANTRDANHIYAPPQSVHLYHEDEYISGVCSKAASIWFVRRKTDRSSCSVRIVWAGMCFPGWSMAHAFR